MRKRIIAIFLSFLFFLPCRDAAGILVTLDKKDVEDAIKTGKKQGFNVTKYLKQRYRFGEENVYEENGTIRTKWGKLAMFSGLLAVKGREPTGEEKDRILKSTNLQIDIHTFGNRIDFADVTSFATRDYKIFWFYLIKFQTFIDNAGAG